MPETEAEMGKKRTHSQDEGPREGAASGIPFEFMGMDRILNDWASAMDPAHLNKQWKTSPPVDFDLLLTSHRRNLETIRQAQQTASELVQNLANLSNHYVRTSFDELGTQARCFASQPPAPSPALKSSLDRAITQCRQVTDLFAESTAKVFNVYRKRFDEGMEEARMTIKTA
jgi:hypothetical protein